MIEGSLRWWAFTFYRTSYDIHVLYVPGVCIVDGASEVYIVCVFENKVCFFSKIRYVFLKYGMFLKKKGMFFSQLFHIF